MYCAFSCDKVALLVDLQEYPTSYGVCGLKHRENSSLFTLQTGQGGLAGVVESLNLLFKPSSWSSALIIFYDVSRRLHGIAQFSYENKLVPAGSLKSIPSRASHGFICLKRLLSRTQFEPLDYPKDQGC